jgi:hypothetical protein
LLRLAWGVVGIVLAVLLAQGCKSKSSHIAELTKAEAPVERQAGTGAWAGADVGTKYFLGDAARTADGAAELKLVGNAIIKMNPYTVLRFGDAGKGAAKIGVELGAIELRGGGSYGLDVGDVKLQNDGAVRITARGQGKSSIELLVGAAQISSVDGSMVNLEIGKIVDLGIGPIEVTAVVDAGVPDAPPADAAVVAVAEGGTIEVVGKKAEIQHPGSTKWEPLAAGVAPLEKGAKIRLGNGTTAKLIANGMTLSLAGGSRMAVGDSLLFGLELGVGTASVPAATTGKVDVPGGTVALEGTATLGAKARLDVNAKGEAKVSVLEGSAKLVGSAPGAELALKTGEAASMAKAGNIQQKAKIPDYYDLKVTVGEPFFTIHDPRGSTALQFDFNGRCPGGGTIEMDTNASFRTARLSGGKQSANILAEPNYYYYRLSCGGSPAASGKLQVRRDAGTRPLPKDPPVNPIDADGRTYRISYQSLVPNVKIKVPGTGTKFKLHLSTGGSDETQESTKPVFTIEGKKLKEATYRYWVDRDGVKQDKVSTLIVDFDQTAPQVYISAPANGKPFAADVEVRGAVLPGWSAKVEGVEIPVDKNTRRFKATVPAPQGASALAIRLAHPQRGIHYYLRRGK